MNLTATPTRFSTYSLVCFNMEIYVNVGLVFKRWRHFNIIKIMYGINWQVFIATDITKLRRTRAWKRNSKTTVNKVHKYVSET